MEQYIIKGGIPLVGEIDISGAKNAALPIISAAIMSDETVTLENIPDVNDINVLLEAIEKIGARIVRVDRHTVKINGSTISECGVDLESMKKIRASYYLLGSLLGKYKKAEVPLPGGCNIGSRPIDLHLKGFRAMGVKVDLRYGNVIAGCDCMHGAHIFLDIVSVGATINIMIAAVMIAVFVMMAFIDQISDFINKHVQMKILALVFIAVIGVLLVLDGMGINSGIELLDMHLEKLMVYFAMVFAFVLELIQMRYVSNLAHFQRECSHRDRAAQAEADADARKPADAKEGVADQAKVEGKAKAADPSGATE